jgi:Domain of unknown function (DUF4350)
MKERLQTAGFAIAALLCFYVLFVPRPPPAGEQSKPLSTEAGDDGYQVAWRWLSQEHIPVASLRERYDRIADVALSPAAFGNVLIITLPSELPFQAAEWQALDRWTAAGNTLLVLAAMDDTPRWALGRDPRTALQRVSGLHFEADATKREESKAQQLRDVLAPRPILFVPQGQHPLLRGVGSLYAISDLPAADWLAHPLDMTVALGIARRPDLDQSVLWLKRAGNGQIIVCAFATPFSNRAITQADNARLLSNIIAWTRAPSGRVIFDDAHQGLVSFYDPTHFFADPRLHRTLLWMLILWLVFVLGPQRLRSAVDPWHAVDETALLEASGRFYTVAVDPADARRTLFENFFNALRRRLGWVQNGEPVWEWLGQQAAITAAQRSELQDLYARVCAQQRVNLPRLHNFLITLEGQLK